MLWITYSVVRRQDGGGCNEEGHHISVIGVRAGKGRTAVMWEQEWRRRARPDSAREANRSQMFARRNGDSGTGEMWRVRFEERCREWREKPEGKSGREWTSINMEINRTDNSSKEDEGRASGNREGTPQVMRRAEPGPDENWKARNERMNSGQWRRAIIKS